MDIKKVSVVHAPNGPTQDYGLDFTHQTPNIEKDHMETGREKYEMEFPYGGAGQDHFNEEKTKLEFNKGRVEKNKPQVNKPAVKVIVDKDGTIRAVPVPASEGKSMFDYKSKMAYILKKLAAPTSDMPEYMDKEIQEIFEKLKFGGDFSLAELAVIEKKFGQKIDDLIALGKDVRPVYEAITILTKMVVAQNNKMVGVSRNLKTNVEDYIRTLRLLSATGRTAANDVLRANADQLATAAAELVALNKGVNDSIGSTINALDGIAQVTVMGRVVSPKVATPKNLAQIKMFLQKVLEKKKAFVEGNSGVAIEQIIKDIVEVIDAYAKECEVVTKKQYKIESGIVPSPALKGRLEQIKATYETILREIEHRFTPQVAKRYPHMVGKMGEFKELLDRTNKFLAASDDVDLSDEERARLWDQDQALIAQVETAMAEAQGILSNIGGAEQATEPQEAPARSPEEFAPVFDEEGNIIQHSSKTTGLNAMAQDEQSIEAAADASTELLEDIEILTAKGQDALEAISANNDRLESIISKMETSSVEEKEPALVAAIKNKLKVFADGGEQVGATAQTHFSVGEMLDLVNKYLEETESVETKKETEGMGDPFKAQLEEMFKHNPALWVPKVFSASVETAMNRLSNNVSNVVQVKVKKGDDVEIKEVREEGAVPYRKKDEDKELTDPAAKTDAVLAMLERMKSKIQQAALSKAKETGYEDVGGLKFWQTQKEPTTEGGHTGHIIQDVFSRIKNMSKNKGIAYYKILEKILNDFWVRGIAAELIGEKAPIAVSYSIKTPRLKTSPEDFLKLFQPVAKEFMDYVNYVIEGLNPENPKHAYIIKRYTLLRDGITNLENLISRAYGKVDPKQFAQVIEDVKEQIEMFDSYWGQMAETDEFFASMKDLNLDKVLEVLDDAMKTSEQTPYRGASIMDNLTRYAAEAIDSEDTATLESTLNEIADQGIAEFNATFDAHMSEYNSLVSELKSALESKPQTGSEIMEELAPEKVEEPELAGVAGQEDKLDRTAAIEVTPALRPNDMYSNFDLSENTLELRQEGDKKKLYVNKTLKNLITKRIHEMFKGAYKEGDMVSVEYREGISVGTVKAYLGSKMYKVSISGEEVTTHEDKLFKI